MRRASPSSIEFLGITRRAARSPDLRGRNSASPDPCRGYYLLLSRLTRESGPGTRPLPLEPSLRGAGLPCLRQHARLGSLFPRPFRASSGVQPQRDRHRAHTPRDACQGSGAGLAADPERESRALARPGRGLERSQPRFSQRWPAPPENRPRLVHRQSVCPEGLASKTRLTKGPGQDKIRVCVQANSDGRVTWVPI